MKKADTTFAPYLHFGAQGPDFFFFNTKDIDPALRTLVEMYYDVMDFMEDFREAIMAIIPEELKQAVRDLETFFSDLTKRSVLLTEIQQSLTEAKNTIELLKSNLKAATELFITDSVNVFEILKHPIQDAQNHSDWWWFDTLHYRRSGKYAKALLQNSVASTAEHAYALGYLTHFASDTVGHPFVNILSGGPYRTHPQRHKFVENHHDTFAFDKLMGGTEFVQSKLYKDYIMENDPDKLPDGLNDLILKSLKEVYFSGGQTQYGKSIDKEDLNDTYRMWLSWFKKTTDLLDLPKPEAYSLSKELVEAWETFKNNVSDIGDMISSAGSGGGGILSFFKFLAALILGSVLFAAAVIDYVLGNLATLGAAPIRFLISLAYEGLYNSFMDFHQGIVLNGLAFPFKKELAHPFALHANHTALTDRFGRNASSLLPGFPTQKFTAPGMENESHLIYPFSPSEHALTLGAPLSYFNSDPLYYLEGPVAFDPDVYGWLKAFEESPDFDPFSIIQKYEGIASRLQQEGLGNAVDFSCFLYEEFLLGNEIPDFNLDGDRGMGYKSWRKVAKTGHLNDPFRPHVAVNNSVQHEQTDTIHPNNNIL